MISMSTLRYARCTPRKARRVVDLIRGKKAGEAIVALRFMPYRAAKVIEKVLRSAMANAEQRKTVDPDALTISRAFVDVGPVMKRMRARSMGRGNVVRKRLAHITVELSEKTETR